MLTSDTSLHVFLPLRMPPPPFYITRPTPSFFFFLKTIIFYFSFFVLINQLFLAALAFVIVGGLFTVVVSLVPECGSWRAGSVIEALGLSCSLACEVFSNQGSNPCSLP